MACDEFGKKTYALAQNDDRLNIHNPYMISIWRANMDCPPVVLKILVIKYIAKYASKEKRKSESCIDMLMHICKQQVGEDHALSAYRRFMSKIIVDRDIGAQETCHMLQNHFLLAVALL